MILGTAVKTFDEWISTPMSLVLRAVPEEGLTDADEDDDDTDDGLEADGH